MNCIQALQKHIRKNGWSAALVSKPENVHYLSGFTGTSGWLFVTPKKSVLITDFRYFVTARKLKLDYYDRKAGLKKLIGRYKTIAFEDEFITVAKLKRLKKALPGVRWKPIGDLVARMRMIKSPEEIRIIKKGVQITEVCLKRFSKTIRPGQSEDEMEWKLLSIARELGAEGFSFPPIITFGKNTADVHHQKEAHKLKKGEQVLIDFGLKYKGYCTDMTRMFYPKQGISLRQGYGQCKEAEQKIYSTVLKANQQAIKAIAVGKKFSEIDQAARQVIEKAGYGEYFGHATGHGIGFEVHELPNVSQKSEDTVQPGMVFTIEPGIYIDGVGGVRIEDMVYVDKKGKVEVLTGFNRNMVIL